MAYPALPDRRMPYDNDGTRVGMYVNSSMSHPTLFANGLTSFLSSATLVELNDSDQAATGLSMGPNANMANGGIALWFFFPEQREVTAHYFGGSASGSGLGPGNYILTMQGSTDTTNGVDGTWETPSLPGGQGVGYAQLDGFRAYIKAISFTGAKRVVRVAIGTNLGGETLVMANLYGEKAAGQTPDDLIFIDHDTTPGVEYQAPEDFGNRPLATTVTRQFRVKNASPTKTATTVNIQCNDPDFTISTDGTIWVVTINIASLGPGAESSTLYVRNTTPAPGSLLGPRFARIVTTVASWT